MTLTAEGDASGAVVWLAASALGWPIEIANYPVSDRQADTSLIGILEQFGVTLTRSGNRVRVESVTKNADDRTIDLPLDASWSLSGAYGRFNPETNRGWSLATTLQLFDEAKVDQTSQGVRFAGEFDDYYVLFVGATYRF